jgi:hypothetical protein
MCYTNYMEGSQGGPDREGPDNSTNQELNPYTGEPLNTEIIQTPTDVAQKADVVALDNSQSQDEFVKAAAPYAAAALGVGSVLAPVGYMLYQNPPHMNEVPTNPGIQSESNIPANPLSAPIEQAKSQGGFEPQGQLKSQLEQRQEKYPVVDLKEVMQHPEKYKGKTIRVTGYPIDAGERSGIDPSIAVDWTRVNSKGQWDPRVEPGLSESTEHFYKLYIDPKVENQEGIAQPSVMVVRKTGGELVNIKSPLTGTVNVDEQALVEKVSGKEPLNTTDPYLPYEVTVKVVQPDPKSQPYLEYQTSKPLANQRPGVVSQVPGVK